MTINIGNIRQIIAVMIFLSIVLAGVATAAQDEENATQNASQPFVSATNVIPGTIAFDAAGKITIVQDAFVSAAASAPKAQKVSRVMYVTSTGYNSLPEQTDSSPFIAADGTHVYDGMVAANFLPFGTKIMFPDTFPGKIYTVHDRMHPRFSNRVDVWFEHKSDALQWGRRTVKIEILGS